MCYCLFLLLRVSFIVLMLPYHSSYLVILIILLLLCVSVVIPSDKVALLQQNLIRSHSCGTSTHTHLNYFILILFI